MCAFLWLANGCNLCFINLNEMWKFLLKSRQRIYQSSSFSLVNLLLKLKCKTYRNENKGIILKDTNKWDL